MKTHPGEEMLLRFTDDDLPATEVAEVRGHVAECAECRERLENLRKALDGYQRFHETVLKRSLATPPKPWSPVRKSAVLRFPAKRVLAAAAAVVLALGVVWRFERTPSVKAAELLRKAAAAERKVPQPQRRIRLRTRRHTWVRTARLAPASAVSADEAQIQAMFHSAGYSWEDPLSAEAFSRWRERLPQKDDRVSTISDGGALQSYVVSTSASSGELAEATMTLRARDLHAVAGTLRFRSDDTIEMTELVDEAAAVAAAQAEPLARPAPAPPAIATPSPQLGPGEELRVVAALHRIGADLGEPVDVKRDGGAVIVIGVGLTAGRQEQLRAAVAGIAGVELRFEEVHGHNVHPAAQPRRAAPRLDTPNRLIVELQAALGGNVSTADLSDQLIDGNDRAMQQAYALRSLARRFPAEVERELKADDMRALHGLASDHVAALARSAAEMRRLLAPILPVSGHGEAGEASSWQSVAETMLASVQELDQMLDGASAADAGGVARVLGRIDGQIAAMQRMVK